MIPNTGFAPAHKPVVAGRVRAIALRNIRPRRSSPKPPQNPVQYTPVIDPGNTTRFIRQQRLDNRPLKIAEFVTTACHPRLQFNETLNHDYAVLGIPFMSLEPSRSFTLKPLLGVGAEQCTNAGGDGHRQHPPNENATRPARNARAASFRSDASGQREKQN